MVDELRHLKEVADSAYYCGLVGDCRTAVRPSAGWNKVCPVRGHTPGFEPYFSRGKMLIIRGLLEGKLKLTSQLANVLYQCMVCGGCKAVCFQSTNPDIDFVVSRHIDQVKVFEALRADLVDAGLGPMPRHKVFLEWTKKEHNPYMEKYEDRIKWMDGIPQHMKRNILSSKSDIVLFMGCTGPYRQQDLCEAFAKIMDAAGVDFSIIYPGEWCCGSTAFRTGVLDVAEGLMKHNMDAWRKWGAETVITFCAGCYRTIKMDYPQALGEPLPFRMLHAVEFFEELINEGRLNFKKEVNLKVAYHDPCHLGRHIGLVDGVYDAPRNVLKAIPGIELVEMRRIRENSWCCGAGGGVKSGFPDLAVEMAKDRCLDAREVGADALVSACPFCRRNLLDASPGIVDFYDVMELMMRSLGLE